jgi:hypothetical protein
VEQWEDEKGMETILPPKKFNTDSEGNEENDIQFQTQTKQR